MGATNIDWGGRFPRGGILKISLKSNEWPTLS